MKRRKFISILAALPFVAKAAAKVEPSDTSDIDYNIKIPDLDFNVLLAAKEKNCLAMQKVCGDSATEYASIEGYTIIDNGNIRIDTMGGAIDFPFARVID